MNIRSSAFLIRTITFSGALLSAGAICAIVFTTELTPFFAFIGAPFLLLGVAVLFERLDKCLNGMLRRLAEPPADSRSSRPRCKASNLKQAA